MDIQKLAGTGVAIVTPFRNDGTIDFQSFEKLIEFQVSNHVDYIVALGTTGESATLSKEEKKAVISFVIDQIDGRLPVIVGCGGNNTQQILNELRDMDYTGIDALLSVSPYYNKPSQEGIYQHYNAIASASQVPIILYNVPGRTGSNICACTTLRLAVHKNIIAIKEASGDLTQITTILRDRPDNFLVISGDDALTLPMIALGADGVISVIANALPKEFSDLVRHALNGDFIKARAIQLTLLNLFSELFLEGNPVGVKAALSIAGISGDHVRLPLVSASDELKKRLSLSLDTVKKSQAVSV